MKSILIIIFIIPAFCNAQLSTNQKAQVTTMIATAVKTANDKNTAQDVVINKLIADTIAKSKTIILLLKKVDSLTVSLDTTVFTVKNKIITIPSVNDLRLRVGALEVINGIAANRSNPPTYINHFDWLNGIGVANNTDTITVSYTRGDYK